jgi:hypothetical protein
VLCAYIGASEMGSESIPLRPHARANKHSPQIDRKFVIPLALICEGSAARDLLFLLCISYRNKKEESKERLETKQGVF